MSLVTRNSMLLGVLMIAFQSNAAMQGTEIHFHSSCDFKELTMNIIDEQDVKLDYVALNIKLQPAARNQLTQLSHNHINQSLNTYINGIKINTATIRTELNTEDMRIIVDKRVAKKIFPGLLDTKCPQK